VLPKIFPLILMSILFSLTACNDGKNVALEDGQGDSFAQGEYVPTGGPNDGLHQGSEEGEVMVPDVPEVMREDPAVPMDEVPAEQVFDLNTCQSIFFSDATGSLTFHRCFASNYPVLSTKGACVDDRGLKIDRCPNDTTPACRLTSDPKVLACEELGKQWCVNTDSNARELCPTI